MDDPVIGIAGQSGGVGAKGARRQGTGGKAREDRIVNGDPVISNDIVPDPGQDWSRRPGGKDKQVCAAPPVSTSLPAPPSSRSAQALPFRLSFPSSPKRRRCRAPPKSVSPPEPASTVLASVLPLTPVRLCPQDGGHGAAQHRDILDPATSSRSAQVCIWSMRPDQ